MTTTITLSDRQFAHVLAALRDGQYTHGYARYVGMPHFDGIEGGPLGSDEVDALCEALNCSDTPSMPAAHDGTLLDPMAMREALTALIEWDAFMGFNEADVWRNARLAMGHSVEEEEEEGRACFHCAVRLDPGEGVDAEDGLLCYDCDQYQGPCSDEEG